MQQNKKYRTIYKYNKKNNTRMKQKITENHVIVKNGRVKTIIGSDYISLEEARRSLHDMVDKEYALP